MPNIVSKILLFQADGAVILCDISAQVLDSEEPVDAARRAVNQKTHLDVSKEKLLLYYKFIDGTDAADTYYFGIGQVDKSKLAGINFKIIHNLDELEATDSQLKEVLAKYFEGFRTYLFLPDIDEESKKILYDTHLKRTLAGHQPSKLKKPVVLACTGLVASGKSTVASPLAEISDCVAVSSDMIREEFFIKGFSFAGFRPFMNDLIKYLSEHRYNIFLDFNISTNTQILDNLIGLGYQPFIIHANPPFEFIKNKILSGNMKHELTFFAKDEHVYMSMLTWKDEHAESLPKLKQKYGIWREVDTSRKDLKQTIAKMRRDFKLALEKL